MVSPCPVSDQRTGSGQAASGKQGSRHDQDRGGCESVSVTQKAVQDLRVTACGDPRGRQLMIESRDEPIRELLDQVYRDEPPFKIIDTRRGERALPVG